MNAGLNRLVRLAKYLSQLKTVGYEEETDAVKLYIIKGKVEKTPWGTVYIYNDQIRFQLNLWLREKVRDLVNIGIMTESRIVGVEFYGQIEIKEEENYVILTLKPSSPVSISSA